MTAAIRGSSRVLSKITTLTSIYMEFQMMLALADKASTWRITVSEKVGVTKSVKTSFFFFTEVKTLRRDHVIELDASV